MAITSHAAGVGRQFCGINGGGISLVSQRVHDDCVGNQAERMNLSHQNVGGDFMELNVLEKVPDYLLEWRLKAE